MILDVFSTYSLWIAIICGIGAVIVAAMLYWLDNR